MIVFVLLNLLNKFSKSDKMKDMLRILPLFRDSRSRGCGSLSKTLYPLLSTSSTEEDTSQHDFKKVDKSNNAIMQPCY